MKKGLGITLLCLALAGCGKIPTLSNGEEAIVSLKDNHMISVNELYNELKETYGPETIINMIDKYILETEYKDKITEAEDAADSYLESAKEYYVDDEGNYDESKLLSDLHSYYGINSIEEYRDMVYLSHLKNLAVEDYAKDQVTNKEIKAYYKKETIGDIKASHILIKPDIKDDATDEEKTAAEEKALKEAKDLIKKLNDAKDVSKTFAELAKEYSDDTSKDNGGDLGYFNKGDMVSEFETAVLKLENGKYTKEPVKTSYGYHIILKVEQKAKPELEEVKESIIETLSQEKISSDYTYQIKGLTAIRKKYDLNIIDSDLNEAYNKIMNTNLQSAKDANASAASQAESN